MQKTRVKVMPWHLQNSSRQFPYQMLGFKFGLRYRTGVNTDSSQHWQNTSSQELFHYQLSNHLLQLNNKSAVEDFPISKLLQPEEPPACLYRSVHWQARVRSDICSSYRTPTRKYELLTCTVQPVTPNKLNTSWLLVLDAGCTRKS